MQNIIKILNDNNIKYIIINDIIHLEDTILDLLKKKLVGILDVSMVKNSEYLDCSYNKISEIICNKNLENISCFKNPILKLNRNNFDFIRSDIYI